MIKNLLKNTDALLISSPSNIIYLARDFGFSKNEREVFLLLTKNNKYIVTDKRYSTSIINSKIDYQLIDVGALAFLNKDIEDIIKKEKIGTLGIEESDLTILEYRLLKNKVKTKNIDLKNLRIIKLEKEILNIKKACQISDETFKYIMKQFKVGISEKEISTLLENFIKTKDAEISFRPIIAFGKNSAIPHHLSNQTKLKKNQIILLDFGVKFNNYCSDMSRTIFFGKADKKFKEIYETVLEAQIKAFKSIKVNLMADKIDKIARDYIVQKKYPNIPHALGHGIGLEVHEAPQISPRSNDKIQNGMIFSLEPGIYIENYGGVRIEDLVLVKDNKPVLLYSSNREIIEVQ